MRAFLTNVNLVPHITKENHQTLVIDFSDDRHFAIEFSKNDRKIDVARKLAALEQTLFNEYHTDKDKS